MLDYYEGKMNWHYGQPIDMGYYLCAIVGNNKPSELYWDGSSWSYQNSDWETLDSNEVACYMYLGDIPMPEGW
jgi:hypothetical protein